MKKTMLMLTTLTFTCAFAFGAEVDLKNSEVKWRGTKVTGEHYGQVKLKKAKVDLDGEKLKKAEFVVDLNSITVEDLTDPEWSKKFLTHMKSKDFFEVEKHPTAKLVTTKVEGSKVTANLTIKDKTHPVTFDFKKKDGKYVGEFKFNRTKFDMIYGSGSFFKNLADKAIHDDVELKFTVALKKESPKKEAKKTKE